MLFKNGNRWLGLLTMHLLRLPTYYPGPDLHCAEPLALGELCNIFLENIGEDQKSLTFRARGTSHCAIW